MGGLPLSLWLLATYSRALLGLCTRYATIPLFIMRRNRIVGTDLNIANETFVDDFHSPHFVGAATSRLLHLQAGAEASHFEQVSIRERGLGEAGKERASASTG